MRRLRKVIFWMHLITGVSVALVVLVMSATGVLLMYEKPVLQWADTRGLVVAPPPAGASPLPIESLLAQVSEAQAGKALTGVTARRGPDQPVAVELGRERTVFVNPYTGAILGEGARSLRRFFRVVTDVHRWLAMSGDQRGIGRAITGGTNLGFLFLVASGFYIWWPKQWTWARLWFRRGLPGKARDFNWHNTIGFWSVVPLFIIVLSGVVISYPWAGDRVYRVVGEQPPARRAAAGAPVGPPAGRSEAGRSGPSGPARIEVAGLNDAFARAQQQVAGWRTVSTRFSDQATWTFTIDEGSGGQPQKRGTLVLNRQTAQVVRWEPYGSLSAGRRLRSWLRFAHTGEVFGIVGQTIAGLVSAGQRSWSGPAWPSPGVGSSARGRPRVQPGRSRESLARAGP
jgi:uncharacterized iron-regulated membrane protein